MQPGSARWLEDHGIDPDVWAARGVWAYTDGDEAVVKQAVLPYIKPTAAGWITRVVRQSDGLVMPKHAPAGYDPIAPQLRPNAAVVTDPRPRYRYHGTWGAGDWPTFPAEAGKAAGKYLPRRFVLTPEAAERHIITRHNGVNLEYVHRDDKRPAKYLFLPNADQKRIDLHPRAAEILPAADRVFFVLEGALKNDAVLSQGEAVFSVPSVTLWSPGELERFAKRLAGKVVFVVPDADWFTNPLVDQQALYVRTILRRAGLDAYIAAPPMSFPEKRDQSEKGIDDFLGHGHTVSEMEIRGREAGPGVHRWGDDYRAQRALEGLSLHAKGGRHRRSLGSMLRVMGLDRGKRRADVPKVLEELRHTYTILEGTLEIEIREWNEVAVTEWREQPTLELKPEYRPFELPTTLLGDFWAREAYAMAKEAKQAIERDRADLERRVQDQLRRFLKQ